MNQQKIWIGVVGLIAILGIGYVLVQPQQNTAGVATLPSPAPLVMEEGTDMKEETAGTIVDIAVGNKDFSTLVTAVTEAGLVGILSGEGPFTVFAPTNTAFAKLPSGTLESLLKDKVALSKVLTYHVVAGNISSSEVVTLTSTATVQGQPIKIEVKNGDVYINESKVVTADIKAKNGTIHVIDTVLLPQ